MAACRMKRCIKTVTPTTAHSCEKSCPVGAVMSVLVGLTNDRRNVKIRRRDTAFLMPLVMVEEALYPCQQVYSSEQIQSVEQLLFDWIMCKRNPIRLLGGGDEGFNPEQQQDSHDGIDEAPLVSLDGVIRPGQDLMRTIIHLLRSLGCGSKARKMVGHGLDEC